MPGFIKPLAAGMAFLFLLAGCGTTQDHRIRVYSQDFKTLDEERREMIRAGRIDYGFHPRHVYMALGDPLDRRLVITGEGEQTIWTYAGRIREDDHHPPTFRTTSDMIWGSPFRRQAYDRLQVVFEDEQVTRIRPLVRAP